MMNGICEQYLETDNICTVGQNLLKNKLLAILPCEGPGRRVSIHLRSGIVLRKDIVTKHSERVLAR